MSTWKLLVLSLALAEGSALAQPAEPAAPVPEPAPVPPTAPTPEPAPAPSPAPVTPAPAADAKPAEPKPPEELDPFTFADFTWQTGSARTHQSLIGNQYFTAEFRLDDQFQYSLNRPADDTIGGSTEAWRHGENQVAQLGLGGDLHVDRTQGRFMTQFGELATTTPRNDSSPSRGQWSLDNAYRYISEAYGGYHFGDPHRGVNLQAGIFLSYIGLWSYYNFDNWTYQPSYVSSNTPWFFNGVRLQWFPTDHLKIEPWLINGWQSYARFNTYPGVGGQIRWTPNDSVILIFNNYAVGSDALGDPDRHRFHTDDSVQIKLYEAKNPHDLVTRLAMSFTGDLGCESGGAVRCGIQGGNRPAQYFAGFMSYLRAWHGEKWAATFGGGLIKNPGRYLVLLPPINGATATSGTPYFTENPGDDWFSYDFQWTADYMPSENFTLRAEFTYRHASVPYFSGAGGVTPPGSSPGTYANQGSPGSLATNPDGSPWSPDLVQSEPRFTLALEVKL